MLLRNTHRPDVAVDGRGAHRDRGDVAYHVAVVDRHVRHAAAEVHHGHTLLLLVGGQHRLGSRQGIGHDAQHLDAESLEGHVEPLHRGLEAENEVERRGEFLAERPHGVLHLLVVVHDVVLGHALHDRLVVGGLYVAHAVEERIDILAIDAVLRIVDEDMIRMPGAADEVAGDTCIGLRDVDAALLLCLGDGIADRTAHQLDVLDLAGMNPLDGFRNGTYDIEQPLRRLLTDGDDD